jgi:hypothetical protein
LIFFDVFGLSSEKITLYEESKLLNLLIVQHLESRFNFYLG